MIGLKQHIALVFLGIFIFPLVYQPYHVVRHHGIEEPCHHECCHSHHEKTDGVIYDILSDGDEHCPICDYHFPVNDVPQMHHLSSWLPYYKGFTYEAKPELPYTTPTRSKSPRAPPVSA